MTTDRKRVLLADDHAQNVELLSDLLQPEFEVVATVGDGTALVAAEETLSPDVIVSDIMMPGIDGLIAAETILQRNPAARIVFVTVSGDPLTVRRALAVGAMGYVLKLAAGEELVPAVRAALRGERTVSDTLRVCLKAHTSHD